MSLAANLALLAWLACLVASPWFPRAWDAAWCAAMLALLLGWIDEWIEWRRARIRRGSI